MHSTGKNIKPRKWGWLSQVREKIRAEAEIKRAQVPPQYRAEPYPARQEATEQVTETPRTATSSTFNQGATAPNQPEQATRPRMSDTFNMKSGFNSYSGQGDEPEENINNKREFDI